MRLGYQPLLSRIYAGAALAVMDGSKQVEQDDENVEDVRDDCRPHRHAHRDVDLFAYVIHSLCALPITRLSF